MAFSSMMMLRIFYLALLAKNCSTFQVYIIAKTGGTSSMAPGLYTPTNKTSCKGAVIYQDGEGDALYFGIRWMVTYAYYANKINLTCETGSYASAETTEKQVLLTTWDCCMVQPYCTKQEVLPVTKSVCINGNSTVIGGCMNCFNDNISKAKKAKKPSSSGLSKSAIKKCTKEEKALAKCSDKEIYDVNITELKLDVVILEKFKSSKDHAQLIDEALGLANATVIETFLGSSEFDELLDVYTEAYLQSEEGKKFVEEKVEQWYTPMAALYDKLKQSSIDFEKLNALKIGQKMINVIDNVDPEEMDFGYNGFIPNDFRARSDWIKTPDWSDYPTPPNWGDYSAPPDWGDYSAPPDWGDYPTPQKKTTKLPETSLLVLTVHLN